MKMEIKPYKHYALDMIFTLGRLGLVQGYGCDSRGRPYCGAEDLAWDFSNLDCEVGKTLEVLDANTHTSQVHRTGEEEGAV